MMREWGFNCIRLGIIWDGLEPEPGRYDDEYLAGVDKRIQWAKENGIYVILDMHQDLFSAKFGADGAPKWAVLDDGKPHINPGGVWSAAYFTSPAIHAAFDNFWANKPVSDGIGVQDHFAQAWRHVAERYADEPAVVDYDLFNEPFPGSSITETMRAKMENAAKALARKQGASAPSVTDIMQILTQSDELRKYADDLDLYRAFVDGGLSPSQGFERDALASFYNRVTEAIRQVDQNHIVFMETNIMCNAGTPSGVVPIVNASGNRDPLQAFAPHGYDIVIDTPEVGKTNSDRIELIFERHKDTSKRLEIPVLIGEWGALYGHPDTLPAAQMSVRQIEKHLFSDTYWSYGSSREMNEAPYFPVLARPYPAAIAGTLIEYQSDMESGILNCVWEEKPAIRATNRIYLPEQWFPKGYEVTLEPEGGGWSFEPIRPGSDSGYLMITATGKDVERRLKVQALK